MIRAVKRLESHKIYEKMAGPLILAVGIFYLTFHALSGERGVYALLKEERKREVLQAELKDIITQRKDLEHRVRLMSAGSIDLDLLDEQSRSILGNAGEKEMVIPLQGATPNEHGPRANN
jgi:cell division protein FtsB